MDALKRQRRGWYLFQFSGEILLTNGILYFLPWLTSKGISDIWFNLTLIASSVLLMLTGYIFGDLQDRSHRGYRYLFVTSAVMFVCTLGIHFADLSSNSKLATGLISLVCFGGIMYAFQVALIFYNTMLRRLSSGDNSIKVSGWSVACGWVGAVFGILAVLPFVEGYISLFGPPGKGRAFLPSALLYGLGMVISLFLMRGVMRNTEGLGLEERSNEPQHEVNQKQIWFFLIALFLFGDAVLTIEANASYYLSNVMGLTEQNSAAFFLLLIVMAAIGALIPGQLTKRISPKTMLISILWGWVITLLLVSLARNLVFFGIVFGLIGLVYGALAAVMRAFFLSLVPVRRTGRYFGIYVSFQRFSTLVGPIVWIAAAYFAQRLGSDRYRVSMVAMALLICLSFIFLTRVPNVTQDEMITMSR